MIDRLLKLQARMIVSGYDHPLYDKLTERGWRKLKIATTSQVAARRGVKPNTARTEILWLSPNIPETRQLSYIDN